MEEEEATSDVIVLRLGVQRLDLFTVAVSGMYEGGGEVVCTGTRLE
jgi:hypothetical protein